MGLLGHCSPIFNFLRHLHTVLHTDCTNLHCHQQCRRVPFSLYPLQNLLFVDFFDDGHSDQCVVILHIVLIYISLITSDVNHLHVLAGRLYLFFGKLSIQVFHPFLSLCCFFFYIVLHELFVYFGD